MNVPEKVLPRHPPRWKYDLPLPNEAVQTPITLDGLRTPNCITPDYLEIPRSTLPIRGVVFITGLFIIFSGAKLLLTTVENLPSDEPQIAIESITTVAIILFAMGWLFIPYIRIDASLPRDEPIRFNRSRRKVYFYQYEFDKIYIFSRRKWGVKPQVHDWDDLTAEACRVYAPGHGGLIESIFIAARKPGTDQVIARYFFANDTYLGAQYWDIARLYMQNGADALPKFKNPPRDWDNDAEVGFPRRLAPKVQWPEDIDLESRTAPTADEVR